MEESNKRKEEKDKEEFKVADEDDFLQVEIASKRKRSDKRKREDKVSPDDRHLKTDMTETMGEL